MNGISNQIETVTGETVNLTEKSETNYVAWKVFPTKEVQSLSDQELIDKVGIYRSYQGAGQPYAGEPCVFRSTTRVLVSQQHGWDI
ncbi:MAG TPA: hypothetical protein PKY82_23970 [Pyrinomonadaceae bacterium]|nr:hypothetical protein [Pyrinomonadaceae bacterium]